MSGAEVGAADAAFVRVALNGRVSRLALEDYVARVIAAEGQPNAADGAQQALAITARTYALANLGRHRRDGYDLCDTTHCQVLRASTAASRRAAQATAGRVLLHDGQPANVYYSAHCGGHSELASQVWPGADDVSSHLHEDEACRDEPGWTSEVDSSAIERALRAIGHRGNRLRELRVLERNQSGRVTRLRATGFTPIEVSGQDLRMALNRTRGGQPVRSTAFDLQRVGSGYRFTGTGYGHGVGLCVIGAGRRAAQGSGAEAILKFYFPRLTVGRPEVAARGGLTGSAGRPRASVGAAPSNDARSVDVVVSIATSDASERAAIVELVRGTREELARRIGVKAPAEIRVNVHPSVEAFMRATGQPWWVSGVSDRTQIDLAPIALLRQRGQVERTVRREVAHVLIDDRLREKPSWIREGAASYFADPDAELDLSHGRSCPSDEELERPVSAGAHRSALARAEACFRRAIRDGRRWDQVR
jgi:SpoIID/LytB domain protein